MTTDALLFLVPGVGMVLVAVSAVLVWHRWTGAELKWFRIGAGLWVVAVAAKIVFALLVNRTAVELLRSALPSAFFLITAGLYLGAVSAAFELGINWLAVSRSPLLGSDPRRAVAVGIGAGAAEGLLLGVVNLLAGMAAMGGGLEVDDLQFVQARAAATPLFWLAQPMERILGVIGHASTRGLVLLGAAHQRPAMICAGFAVFALIDGVGAVIPQLPGSSERSLWWVELGTLPFVVMGVACLGLSVRRSLKPLPHDRG